MGIYTRHESIYSSTPLSVNPERDETFIIDVAGTWVPECDLIFYGLMGTEYGEQLYKIRERTDLDPIHIYHDFSFFNASDLVRYLSSTEDLEIDQELTDEEVGQMIMTALDHYDYSQCSETMMRHSIMEIMYHRFVKSVTLVYPWPIRPIDIMYLQRITPSSIFDKLTVASGNIPDIVRADVEKQYTTVISNSIEDIDRMVSDPKEFRCESTMFLLRNHSGNMDIEIGEDGYPDFLEAKMDGLLEKLIDFDSGIPLTGMRFGRFEPRLFSEAEKMIPGFNHY